MSSIDAKYWADKLEKIALVAFVLILAFMVIKAWESRPPEEVRRAIHSLSQTGAGGQAGVAPRPLPLRACLRKDRILGRIMPVGLHNNKKRSLSPLFFFLIITLFLCVCVCVPVLRSCFQWEASKNTQRSQQTGSRTAAPQSVTTSTVQRQGAGEAKRRDMSARTEQIGQNA